MQERWEGHSRVPDAAHRDALRRVRRRVVFGWLRWTTGALFLVFMAFAMFVGPQAADDDQRLIDTAPRYTATVVGLEPARGGPYVTVEVDGRTEELWLGYPGDHEAEIGDLVEVVVDPDDPELVIATTAHDDWAYTPTGEIVSTVPFVVLSLLVAMHMMLAPRPGELRKASRVRTVHDGVVIRAEGDAVTLEVSHARWTWLGRDEWKPRPGKRILVLGELHPDALVLLDDGRNRWPAQRLQRASTAAVEP
ncbi:DUF3592 domain-containing protein [Cellulomonas cellasea]|uniref:Uncharacterized protein n=1 Tax=Cellulomonas cellasea TaxID=43670 RepID=A0A7W4UKP7_9CELL|nr:DUF3592 domain-containing protein [Cellulomonas cellasea]MBB2925490.1 hypothetical protein [Cellulomonas cellasea]